MEENLKLLRRPLGAAGLSVSILGLGTVKFGRNQKIKYPAFELPGDRALLELLDEARGLGVNLLDTAPAYGVAEERLGKLLAGRRDDFILVTKTGEEFAAGESTYDFSAAQTRLSVERSLKRLRLAHLDCVLAHCPRNDLDAILHSPVLETLQQLKDRGDIRSFGASINTVEGGLAALRSADVVMVTHSAEFREHEPVMRRAAELGKGVLVKKGLGSGALAGGGLAEKMRPIFAAPGVSSLIIGTINPHHLRQNAEAVSRALAEAGGGGFTAA